MYFGARRGVLHAYGRKVLGFRRKENSQEAKRFFDRCISVDECLSAGLIAPPIESLGVYATSSPLAAG